MALLRDQARACLAYTKVAEVDPRLRKEYRIAVKDLGTKLRRMGLATTFSLLEQRSNEAGRELLKHIAAARVVGLGGEASELPRRARELDEIASYMLATRELLRLAAWLKRAVEATFDEEHDDAP